MNEYRPSSLRGVWALTTRELKKWLKDPIILTMTIIQPVIWMGLLGKAMNLGGMLSGLPPGVGEQIMRSTFGTADYFSFMAVGIISFTVMFTTMFSGMSVVWDRRLGFLDKVLSTPVSRAAIVFSKILNSTLRGMFQATIILIIAVLLGLQLDPSFTLLNLLGIYLAIFLFSAGLSSLFIALSLRSTRQETQMAIVNLVNLPLMFASNIFFPASMMPEWLQVIARVNPVSYLTDALRQLTILQMDVSALALDFAYLGIFAAVVFTVGVVLARRFLTK
ncbi:MAG: ABC transporter permease [Candidatus Hadarchaeum sp.]|uniref:ABC transporter permease n=1 Tax=Candidatus Hadarchaeum sp. TaxID=2883567 RepID=UPI003D0ED9A2